MNKCIKKIVKSAKGIKKSFNIRKSQIKVDLNI
jgi:hypothetical protein